MPLSPWVVENTSWLNGFKRNSMLYVIQYLNKMYTSPAEIDRCVFSTERTRTHSSPHSQRGCRASRSLHFRAGVSTSAAAQGVYLLGAASRQASRPAVSESRSPLPRAVGLDGQCLGWNKEAVCRMCNLSPHGLGALIFLRTVSTCFPR